MSKRTNQKILVVNWVEDNLTVASLRLMLLSVTWAAPSVPWKERRVTPRHCLLQSKDSQIKAVFFLEINSMTVATHNYRYQYKLASPWWWWYYTPPGFTFTLGKHATSSVCIGSFPRQHLYHIGYPYLYVKHIAYTHTNWTYKPPIHLPEAGVSSCSFFCNKTVNPLISTNFQPPLSSSMHWPSFCLSNNPFSLNSPVTVWLLCANVFVWGKGGGNTESIMITTVTTLHQLLLLHLFNNTDPEH